MKKRFIGLDIGVNCSYLTLLEYEKNELKEIRFFSCQHEELSDQLTELSANIGGHLNIGDQLAAALPAKAAYVRKLELPFRDTKKIMAAVPFSLSSQIPVPTEDCITSAIIDDKKAEGGSRVTAAAIPRQTVEKLLDAAQEADLPVHIIDLSPFSLVPLIAASTKDAVLIAVSSQETTISRIQSGELIDYRLLAKKTEPEKAADIQSISREIKALMATSNDVELPVFIVGDVDSEMLAKKLADMDYEAKELTLQLAGEVIPSAHVHATSLAYRAAETKRWKSFNFRSGEYALKGEWQKLKRALWVAAGLVIASTLIVAAASFVQYRTRSNQVNALQGKMTRLFQQTFPAATAIVDIPLQMKSSIRELRDHMAIIGDSQPQVLPLLKALSEATKVIPIEVQELNMGQGEAKISGHATSFDAINKMAELLGQSPIVENVQVADTQMALKGNQINFRLILGFVPNR